LWITDLKNGPVKESGIFLSIICQRQSEKSSPLPRSCRFPFALLSCPRLSPFPLRLPDLPLIFIIRRWPKRSLAKKAWFVLKELQDSGKIKIVPYQGINIISANCK
jgi:hypothetical protein